MADFIEAKNLKITCNIPMGQILAIDIRECIGSHTQAEVKAVVEPGSLRLSEMELNSQPIVIHSVRNGNQLLLFSGVIRSVSIEEAASYDTAVISAYSLSWFMDLEKKSRSFQDTGETILQLMRRVGEEHSFSLICPAKDREISGPFIQYQETDWEFFLRLATHLEAPVFVANEYEGRGIYIGFPEKAEPVKIDAIREKWMMDPGRVRSTGWGKWEDTCYEIYSGQAFHVGQRVACGNGILWIDLAEMTLNHGVLQCVYRLVGKNYHVIEAAFNPQFKGLSLMGTVLARQDESVKIHLDIDENQEPQRAYSYPWRPDFGNMVYCMPEEGERLRLLIPDGDERHGIGMNCVRQNGPVCEETKNPDNRYFMTESKKKIGLTPSKIELSTESEGSGISVEDGQGDMISSVGEVLIQAGGNLELKGTKIELRAPKEITAVKRQLGSPAVLNICHNLDSMGAHTVFHKQDRPIPKARIQKIFAYNGKKSVQAAGNAKEANKEKEKLIFKLKESLEKGDRVSDYELEPSIRNILSAIPHSMEEDKLSRIALGFRPIAGKTGGES